MNKKELLEKIIKYSIRSLDPEEFLRKVREMSLTTGGGFLWEQTPEGFNFWNNLPYGHNGYALCLDILEYYHNFREERKRNKNFIDLTTISLWISY